MDFPFRFSKIALGSDILYLFLAEKWSFVVGLFSSHRAEKDFCKEKMIRRLAWELLNPCKCRFTGFKNMQLT